MIYAGLIAGLFARYWMYPKWEASRIVRKIERMNRIIDKENNEH